MKTPAIIITTILITVTLLPTVVYQTTAWAQNEELPETVPDANAAAISRPRMDFVRTVDFYLRDGQFITGKLIEEDKSKIIVERINDSAIEVETYAKKDIDSVTINISATPEHKFYESLGDYFAGRTLDFRNDPDDFIQAIRAYTKARDIARQSQRRDREIDDIQTKIDRLEADRKVWTEQAQNRAELKKLELEATLGDRLEELENRLNANNQALDETLKRLDAFAKQTKATFDNVQKNINDLNDDISRRMQVLGERIENNRQLIDDIERYRRYRRYY
jgi:hypothetical protein